jgi:very-short-patch-repair endonuclease
MSACLAGGPSAAASHLEAAALLGARQVITGAPCITTFDGSCARLPGVISHRSQLPASEVVTRHLGIPVVIPPLTVVQVADISHPALVKGVANDLVKMNWTSFRAILHWSERAATPRRGQLALRELCHRAIDLGDHMDSPAARDLGFALIAAGAVGFETNYQVRTEGGLVLIDFAWPYPKVGLEYNGARDHGSRLAQRDDARRRALLTNLGWRIFDANSAVAHAEVVRWVLEALAA